MSQSMLYISLKVICSKGGWADLRGDFGLYLNEWLDFSAEFATIMQHLLRKLCA